MNKLKNLDKDSVAFVRHTFYFDDSTRTYITKDFKEPNNRILFLLSKNCDRDFFDNMPKTFTISTKNTTLRFNTEMLKNTSSVISKFIEDNPNENNYNINITDDDNILSKFEQLYQGKNIIFKEDDLQLIQRFTKLLQIYNCPNELKPKTLHTIGIDSEGYKVPEQRFGNNQFSELNFELYKKWFIKFMTKDDYLTFKIITTKKEYKCNIFSVYTSKVIRQILQKDPTVNEYVYNYDDKNGEFQLICDFFNFEQIDITNVDVNSLKSIAEDLQIECIINFIDNYHNKQKEFSQLIEKHKEEIESINGLFELLYNIKNLGIEKVKNSIVQSKWSKKEEEVQELAAFILQVVKPTFSLQNEMAELLIQLNKEASDVNKLHILIPFIVERLMALYWPNNSQFTNDMKYSENCNRVIDELEQINLNNRCIYSFIRILYKRGIIPKEEIIKRLKNYNFYNNIFNAFFLPELVEINPRNFYIIYLINKNRFKKFYSSSFIFFLKNDTNSIGPCFCLSKALKKYLPDKIELYERMLDNMEPDDEIAKAIRQDDVDKLQQIIVKEKIDVSTFKVAYNIFDDFEDDQSLINYSALYGSVKCFKYLMLNKGEIDDNTFYFSIMGSNSEIIEIAEQKKIKKDDDDDDDDKDKKNHTRSYINSLRYSNIISDKGFVSFWFYLKSVKREPFLKHAGIINYMESTVDKHNYDNIQYTKKVNRDDSINFINCCNINNQIAPTIAMHKNELFDKIFQKLFVNNSKSGSELKYLADLSAINGNIYSLLKLIENGYQISKSVILFAAKNGFYSLTKLLLDLYNEKATEENSISFKLYDYQSIVDSGNLSIFELLNGQLNMFDQSRAILRSINKNCNSIIKYAFDNKDMFDFIQFDAKFIYIVIKESIIMNHNDSFNFLIDQYKKLYPEFFKYDMLVHLLDKACINSNLTAVKILTDFILNINPGYDFTVEFSKSRSTEICQYYLDKKVKIDILNNSSISDLGALDIELFEQLINNVDPNYRNLFSDCIYSAIECRNVKVIDYILKENPPNDDELLESIYTNDVEVVDTILKYNSKPSFINKKSSRGQTALHIAAEQKNNKIVNSLLSIPGIDPSLLDQNCDPLFIAAHNYDYEIIDSILNFYGDDIQYHLDSVYSAMFAITDICFIKDAYICDSIWQIIKRLAQLKSLDINNHRNNSNADQYSLLTLACIFNNIDVVEFLLSLDNINPNDYTTISFNTPLLIALENKNDKMAKLLIKHPKTDINMRNCNKETPLIIAVKNKDQEMIDILMNDERFDAKESRLNYAFIYSKNEIANQLYLNENLDVNEEFKEFNSTSKINALYQSVEINDVYKLDKILQHKTFNIYKAKIKRSIFLSAKNNNINVFKKLINLIDNDINIVNEEHQSLISVTSRSLSLDIVNEILNNEHFDSKSGQLLEAFVQSYSNSHTKRRIYDENIIKVHQSLIYVNVKMAHSWTKEQKVLNKESIPKKASIVEVMDKILNYDKEHGQVIKFNELLPNGKSFFTAICKDFSNIREVSEFLLSSGVDPNKSDKSGVYPLEHAIRINSIELVKSLVNTNKIDYSQLSKGNSYLHLAAQNKETAILSFLLEKNIIDINSVNALGETPLFEACKSKIIGNVELLFKRDNLDYLHCNNNGKCALDIVIQLSPTELESVKQNREKYHNKLISTIEVKSNSNDE